MWQQDATFSKVITLDKKKLKQYKSLQKEVPRLQSKLDKLYEKQENLEEFMGKVQASSQEFPYIEMSVSVQMNNPKEAADIKERIKIIEDRLKKSEADLLEIERFIESLNDSMEREIIEMVFLEGKTYEQVGDEFGYTKGRISQIISNILKH